MIEYEFEDIVKEISQLTDIPEDIVKHRVWLEVLNAGSNVTAAAKEVGVTPHVYDEKMERFYAETDAFIFELMVESYREGKRKVMERIKEMIQNYMEKNSWQHINVLMFGDGVGSDTIYLYHFFSGSCKFF